MFLLMKKLLTIFYSDWMNHITGPKVWCYRRITGDLWITSLSWWLTLVEKHSPLRGRLSVRSSLNRFKYLFLNFTQCLCRSIFWFLKSVSAIYVKEPTKDGRLVAIVHYFVMNQAKLVLISVNI